MNVEAAAYREPIRLILPELFAKRQSILRAEINDLYVQRMRTRWGGCNPNARTIRLNTDSAKKPRECLEHIVVQELNHLLEPTHNARFIALTKGYMPRWQTTAKFSTDCRYATQNGNTDLL